MTRSRVSNPVCTSRGVITLAVFAAMLLVGCSPPLYQSAVPKGTNFDIRKEIVPGKYTIFHYYADWCPACQKWKPTMEAVDARFTDMAVVYVNIGDFDSDLSRRHGITFVPNFKIYDPNGQLVAQGKAADAWLRHQISQRTKGAM